MHHHSQSSKIDILKWKAYIPQNQVFKCSSISRLLVFSGIQALPECWAERVKLSVFPVQECYLENDFTSMYYAAQSLMTLQALYGTIQYIHGKGDCAKVALGVVSCTLILSF